MDEELKNFIKVWTLAVTSLCYCFYISAKIPSGLLRFLSLVPIFYFFTILPLNLSSFHLCGVTSVLLSWLANFKLLLLSFDQGPLSSSSPKLFHFISIACLPIRVKHQEFPKSSKTNLTNKNPSPQNLQQQLGLSIGIARFVLLAVKVILLVLIFHSYNYRDRIHPYVLLAIYCCHVYLEAELLLALIVIPARILLGFELERQFNEPYLATSLQDFWGQRWNLVVSGILRLTVYKPIRYTIGKRWAPLYAVFASFMVSGLIHELLYYHVTRVPPTWEVTWFFVLHGMCTVVEMAVKKVVTDKWGWRLHPVISTPLTVAFVGLTGVWLFFPQLIRNGVTDKAIREMSILVDFLARNVVASKFKYS
ncbi:long-chain-alcohol O-fatty-acyltransferase 5 [Tripterygium wilfordii]|uniref:Long-chain-alcohol O-fatty-acyltransferase 5 n=1 Tax=Tripterygium wilfordii TaxID=458696 RepID=A0A7J7C3D1_TRIWF|nr:probable long-chain-alcohol O-fatty-acyltransferase 5 [Tripterygium wilfordii]KAF5728435.1 long-chain-alcohol O-fatty-acyltransferase 5 [Tripterygium wilfordii]